MDVGYDVLQGVSIYVARVLPLASTNPTGQAVMDLNYYTSLRKAIAWVRTKGFYMSEGAS